MLAAEDSQNLSRYRTAAKLTGTRIMSALVLEVDWDAILYNGAASVPCPTIGKESIDISSRHINQCIKKVDENL